MVTITGSYEGGLHCTAKHGPSGTELSTDAPKDNQGKGKAFSPTDLVATALATCVVTTMALVARRHGVELQGLRYEVTKEMATHGPRKIARLVLKLWLPTSAKSLPEKLMENTAKQCPVHLSLASDVDQVIEFYWA
jgi:uncharacterized OsmC-like protein